MTNAEQLAREIAEEILAGDKHMMHSQIHRIKEIIAAKLTPLVEDAERFHKIMEINDRMQKAFGYDD